MTMKRNNSVVKRNEPMLVFYFIIIVALIIVFSAYESCTGDELYQPSDISEELHINMFETNTINKNTV